MRTPLALPFVVLSLLAQATPALAYCRATTAHPAECHRPCVTEGEPLAWRQAEIHYSFRSEGFGPSLSEARVRDVFAEAFQTWSAVACEGEPLGFRFVAQSALTTHKVGPRLAEPNDNVMWLPSREEWEELGYVPEAYAVTETWYDTTGATIGRIRGADMSFNPDMGPWLVCAGACAVGNDLRNVATHEIGHLLGLSHSAEGGSTMWCDANEGELEKRTLEQDDVAGLCAVYEDVSLAEPKHGGRCDISPGRGAPVALAGVLVALLALVRRRRRGA